MTQIEGVTLASRSDWTVLRPLLFESIGQTLEMVLVTMIVGGILGLVLGVVLYGTRPGNLFENAVVYRILDVIVNIIRPIPFIIFLAAMQPLTIKVIGTSIGHGRRDLPDDHHVHHGHIQACRTESGSRRLRCDRSGTSHGSLEIHHRAYRAYSGGARAADSRLRVPVHRRARHVGHGRIHRRRRSCNFAIAYGYQKFDQTVTWTAVIIMIVLVQVVQGVANAIAKHLLKR